MSKFTQLFKPAMYLMNQLKYPQKFALISCIFFIPLSLVMYLLLSEVQDRVDFAHKEMLGNSYLRPLHQLSEHLPEYQLLIDHSSHSEPQSPEITQLQTKIEQDFTAIQQVEQELGSTLLSTDRFQALRESWQTLREPNHQSSSEARAADYKQLMRQLEYLRLQIGDQSNLILDPDLDTYYLMDATLLRLPKMQQTLSDIRFISQQINSNQKLTSIERSQLIVLAETLKQQSNELTQKMAVGFNHNPAGNLRPALAEPLQELTQSTNNLANLINQLVNANEPPTPSVYFQTANQSLQQTFGLWHTTIDQLDFLLQRRINGFFQKQVGLTGFVLVILAIVMYLFIGFYQGVMDTVRSLSAASKRMVAGTMTDSVTLQSKDELAEVVTSFNHVAAALVEANQEVSQLNQRLKNENFRMSAELDVTRRLQQMLLPSEAELKEVAGLDIAGFMEPATEIGGDYYDVMQHDGKVKISIGDVTGHGLESGVVMIMAQTAVRTLLANGETDPAKFLNAVNRIIYDNTRRMRSRKNMTLAVLEYEAGVLRLTGQHEELIIIRQDGKLEQIDTLDLGFPLGLEQDITPFVAEAKVELKPGDIAVLYTDGITEAMNDQKAQYGLERMHQVLQQNCHRSASEIRQALIHDLMQYIGDQKVFDDITLLVLKQQ
ncbi:SpoIIE family protein phosphatase [Pantanalinema rosaneae CENA516]|uniref:SpoIIE family protein phosphatase n=1 Tax=Pantanalinema rosaneae TaxID=1620701 RepID=UPI003D7001B3